MGSILKFFTILLLIAIVLLFLIPIGWIVWQLILLIFGGCIFIFADILWAIVIIGGIILIVKAIFN